VILGCLIDQVVRVTQHRHPPDGGA
jgi:hypothetical protein